MSDFGHSIDSDFDLAGSSIKGYLEGIDPTFTRGLAEIRIIGTAYVQKLAGHYMGAFALDGDFHPTLDAALWTAFTGAAPVAWVYYPQGNSEGQIKYSGTCWVSQYKPGPAAGEYVKTSFSLECAGEVSRGTV